MNTKTFAPEEIADIFMSSADIKEAQDTLGEQGFPVHRIMGLSFVFREIAEECADAQIDEQGLRRQFVSELKMMDQNLLTVNRDA